MRVLLFLVANLPSRLDEFNIGLWKRCFVTVTQQSTTMRNRCLHCRDVLVG